MSDVNVGLIVQTVALNTYNDCLPGSFQDGLIVGFFELTDETPEATLHGSLEQITLRIGPDTQQITLKINGIVMVTLFRQYFIDRQTDVVQLTDFIHRGMNRYGHLPQFSKSKIHLSGKSATATAKFWFPCSTKKYNETCRLPVWLVIPAMYGFPDDDHPIRTRFTVPHTLAETVINSIGFSGDGLSEVKRVTLSLNDHVRFSLTPKSAHLTSPNTPVWTIPLGLYNGNNTSLTQGVNVHRIDKISIDVEWNICPRVHPLYITFGCNALWELFDPQWNRIYGDLLPLSQMCIPKKDTLWPKLVSGAMREDRRLNTLQICQNISNHVKNQRWDKIKDIIDNTSWLSYNPRTIRNNIHIEGYWSNDFGLDNLPIPVPSDTPNDPKFMDALACLESGLSNAQYLGISHCRICNMRNGSGEFKLVLDDGQTFQWPEGLMHYYSEHHVRPSDEFYTMVMAHMRDVTPTPHHEGTDLGGV